MDFLTQVTQFLAALLPWICLGGFLWVLRRLGRMERVVMALWMLMAVRQGLSPFGPFNNPMKGGVKDAEAHNRRGSRDRGPEPQG